MAKTKRLFEYLVVRDQLKQQLRHLMGELKNTFEKKRHLFGETRKTFTENVEGAQPVVEEQSDIQSTVMSELTWLGSHWIKAIDVARQVEEGNTTARADVVLDDGTVLATGLPATALLELVTRADELQQLLKVVPTLDPAKAFTPDPVRGEGIFQARPVNKKRTKKVVKHQVVVPPTDHHPAQVVAYPEDVEVGALVEQEWSGMITPARKSDMLARAEELRRALKSALQRANATDLAAEPQVGEALLSYVLGVSVGAGAQAGSRSQQ